MGQALSLHCSTRNIASRCGTAPSRRGRTALPWRGWAATPAEAVAASDITLVNVVDHDAVDVWLEAAGDAVDGRVIVGLRSDTPDRARQTAKLVDGRGGRYLDGAIMTPTTTIGTPSASILFAGPEDVEAHRELLAALGRQLARRGPWPRRRLRHGTARRVLDFGERFLHALRWPRVNGIAPGEFLPHARGIVEILAPIFAEIADRVEADRHDESSAPVSSVAASLRHLDCRVARRRCRCRSAAGLQGLRRRRRRRRPGAEEVSRVAAGMRLGG